MKNLLKHNISKQQDKIVRELINIDEEEEVPIKELLLLLFFLYNIAIEDWKNYTIIEKAVFLLIWSPLLWLLPAFLMEI